ncbi:BMP and activin membrane-bound inhibitor homolog [Argopecten irradians]|uniref:BMP and activin membrane-bound inhibitor homolog n=1 Tax=Argopecten irradians TaxID=31199 RepID=UPI003711801F
MSAMWLGVLQAVICGSIVFTLTAGLECVCTTQECMDRKMTTCRASHYCYSETIDDPLFKDLTSRGCIDSSTPLLCENRRPAKLRAAWPVLHCCNDRSFCNENVVPTQPPRPVPEVEEPVYEDFNTEPTPQPAGCPNQHGTNSSHSIINPIYIAVPVAGVCVLLALIIFAMYLLRRRTDYYERYQYPRTVSVPQHHQQCSDAKCANACKLNRCTDSERSSSGSETKLFL